MASARAEAALEEARRRHNELLQEIGKAREALDQRADAEDSRWNKEKKKLEDNLRRARE